MITVHTNQYVFAHGKQPRGTGWWAFRIGNETFYSVGTYTKAKRDAIAMAQVKGEHSITVLS